MQLETQLQQNQMASHKNNSQNYSSQNILTSDHICDEYCLDYGPLKIYILRLFQEGCLNYSLQSDEAFKICQYMLIQSQESKQSQKQKSNSICKNCQALPFQKTSTIFGNIKQIIKKLQTQGYSVYQQSALIGLPIKKVKYINDILNLIFNSAIQSGYKNISKTKNRRIYHQCIQSTSILLQIFNLQKIIYQYQVSKNFVNHKDILISLKAITKENKSKQFIYALTFLNLIAESRHPIYIDETGIGNPHQNIKLWLKKSDKMKIDRAQQKSRINVIGALGENLLIYQCLRFNVNSFVIKNFLTYLIQICNQKYGFRNYFFVLDNASVHKARHLQKEVYEYLTVLFLPPSSPQLNPIEKVWGRIQMPFLQTNLQNWNQNKFIDT